MKFVNLEDVTERLQYWSGGFDYIEVPTDYAVEQMESLPMFELVRCEDCKWCKPRYDTDGNAPYWWCKNWDAQTDADGYCYEGEVKE